MAMTEYGFTVEVNTEPNPKGGPDATLTDWKFYQTGQPANAGTILGHCEGGWVVTWMNQQYREETFKRAMMRAVELVEVRAGVKFKSH